MDSKILSEFSEKKTGFFRFKPFGDAYLITNDAGSHVFLSGEDFEKFVKGVLPEKGSVYKVLAERGYIKGREDESALAGKFRDRNRFLGRGPSLHIVVVTLNCDHSCVYCQAGAGSKGGRRRDMTLKTAKAVVDRIFESPGRAVSMEFQGGEPLLNWPVVKFIIEYAGQKNKKARRKIDFSLVTNLAAMDGGRLDYLIKNRVRLCTSIDGPRELHNKNRICRGGNSHAAAVKWWREIRKKTRPHALVTVTRESLARPREIVDEYLGLGAEGVFLRALSPLGAARGGWDGIGYTAEEFLGFYGKAFDYILDLNLSRGKVFFEQTARIFLLKILTGNDPGFLDLRSPCGGGTGQLAYNYDGKVFTCDEGRMLGEMGDDSFCVGDAARNSYLEFVSHPAVKCVAVSSCLDAQTSCSWCVYKPYCGVCPIFNYTEQNDLFGRMPSNMRCKIYSGILDIIFEKLGSPKYARILESWARQEVA